eukprot:PhM_4_TR10616/c0_g1_i1/m.85504
MSTNTTNGDDDAVPPPPLSAAAATAVVEGSMHKLGGGAFEMLQERYFVLQDRRLCYYSKRGANDMKGDIDVAGSRIIDRGTYKGKHCFSIEGINYHKGLVKEYFLFCESRDDKWRWLTALMTASGRYTFLESASNVISRMASSPLYDMWQREDNQVCADCGAPHPTWAVVEPYGTMVCIDCIGVHRELHSHRCKELQLDAWSDGELDAFRARGGNSAVNAVLEHHVPESCDLRKPVARSRRELRRRFIVAKYVDGEFASDRGGAGKEPRAPQCDPGPVARTADSGQSPRSTPLGAPPRYVGVAFVMLDKMSGLPCGGKVRVVLTNGFQAVSSPAGRESGDDVVWAVPLQIGIDTQRRPLYFTVVEDERIAATGELVLADVTMSQCADAEGASVLVNLWGKGVKASAGLSLSVNFTQMA